MIPFNKPLVIGAEKMYIEQTLLNDKFSGDGLFTKKCHEWFESRIGCKKILLTTSCTHALEMTALLAQIMPGDEVIMPSYTFVSTANAFVLRGATIVFVDIRPDTMNLDETLIEAAITEKTKAIVVVHYGGVACEMDTIMNMANKYNLVVIEDAAQGVMATYKGRPLGTIGQLGAYSFHETKNYNCGEGGALVINDECFISRSEILREKGTNRSKFFRGEVDKYTWVDLGSSYLPSELNAAFLYAQIEVADKINDVRIGLWYSYYQRLEKLRDEGRIELPFVPDDCKHNGHLFYIKCRDLDERTALINLLKKHEILTVFHYIPLHSAPAGKQFGRFNGEDKYTTLESERLLRLPMYYGLQDSEVDYITMIIGEFFNTL